MLQACINDFQYLGVCIEQNGLWRSRTTRSFSRKSGLGTRLGNVVFAVYFRVKAL